MSTQAQLAANRANAQLSTGPKTAEGKQKVSLNAVKSALTGVTVLLPTDDAALYEKHVAETFAAWKPETHREQLLVQTIADTEWRLHRIPGLISGTIALARIRNTEHFENYPEHLRPLLVEAHLEEICGRQLRNLQLQESRLRRYRDRSIAELKELQAERRKAREESLKAAAIAYLNNPDSPAANFQPGQFGFEFSIEEIRHAADQLSNPNPPRKKAA